MTGFVSATPLSGLTSQVKGKSPESMTGRKATISFTVYFTKPGPRPTRWAFMSLRAPRPDQLRVNDPAHRKHLPGARPGSGSLRSVAPLALRSEPRPQLLLRSRRPQPPPPPPPRQAVWTSAQRSTSVAHYDYPESFQRSQCHPAGVSQWIGCHPAS